MTQDNNKGKEKMNFFHRMKIAVKDFELYGILASERLVKSIKYFLILILIFTIFVTAVFTYQFGVGIKQAISYFNENIAEISYNQGNLSINDGQKLEIKNNNFILPYILIDTSVNEEDMTKYEEDIQMYTNGIIILKDKIIYKNELLSQLQIYNYKEITDIYGITEFNKQQINNFINQVNEISLYTSFFIVMFIYLYIIYVCTTFVDIMMLGVLGFIVARIIGIKMRFKASFNIGVYALTLPIILNLIYIIINSFTNFTIQNFQWMYRTISYIYVIVAILMIKTDFINQQIELQKILEEQERVKKQMQEEKEENKKEEKKENDDPKDENTDQDDKPKENPLQKKNRDNNLGNDGLAPQGIKDLPNNQ